MALQRSIFLGTYRSTIGVGYVLKVQQGGHKQYDLSEYRYQTGDANQIRNIAVFNGDIYIPNGKATSPSYGHVSYSPELNQFYQSTGVDNTMGPIPFGDRAIYFYPGFQGWGGSPKIINYKTGAVTVQWNDWARLGNQLFLLDTSYVTTHIWTYPFTTLHIDRVPPTAQYRRLCELKGEMYCLSVVNAGVTTLMKWNKVGSIWQNVGNFAWPVDNAKIASNTPSNTLLFKYNNKLWAGIVTAFNGAARIRIVQVNEATGAIIQDANALGWMPAIWNMASSAITASDKIFEIRDDTGSSEQVFIVRCGDGTYGAWEIYEFQEAAFTLVDSGLDLLSPYAGIIYDENTKSAEMKSIADTIPSNYATINITTGDLMNNGAVDIDPRYRDLSSPSITIPYDAMTEKTGVGSCGKTGLSSKPSFTSTPLSQLDDAFSDQSINSELWEAVNPTIYNNQNDMGCLYTSGGLSVYTMIESPAGELVFGAAGNTFVAQSGIGVQSKWVVNGAFTLDITVNPAGLVTGNSYGMYCVMKVATDIGYGFQIYNDGANKRARGLYMVKNTVVAFNGVSTAVVTDGTVIRIARDGSNVWSVILAPSGANENILDDLSGMLPYSEGVHLWMWAQTLGATAWATGTFPAIKDVAWSGAGTIARYRHVKPNNFMWDHIADLGADKTLTAETYVDVAP